MPTARIAAQFNEISRVYDETREPLDPTTFSGLVELLRRSSVASILEVGVGTGRIAGPLGAQGFSVTGADVSSGMLARARAKGIARLVRASGYHLPFADRTFDAALFVHVLHLLEDPLAALREANRVGSGGAFALVHPVQGPDHPEVETAHEARRLLREVLVEQQYPTPPNLTSPWTKERDLLSRFPPDALEVVSDQWVTRSLREELDRFAKRGNRNLLEIPPAALERALATARARAGDRTVTFRQVEAIARWTAVPAPR